MKMFLSLLFTLFALTAQAYVVPIYRDLKPATQVMVEKQDFGSPEAADDDQVIASIDGPSSAAAVVITSFTAQPDVPRNLTIDPGSSTGDVAACVITVAGTNIYGRSISETFTFADNDSAPVTGAKAFKTVTSVSFPANCESETADAKWNVGVGDKIGLNKCMASAGEWMFSRKDDTYSATRASVTADADEVEKNVVDFNEAMDDSAVFYGYYIQNFVCKP